MTINNGAPQFQSPDDSQWEKRDFFIYGAVLAVILLIYYFLNDKYRVYYVDDAWCLSYVYNYIFHGVDLDTLIRPQDSPRRILYFSKLFHFVVGHILNLVGWSRANAHAVSSLFMFSAASVWYFVLRALDFPKHLCVVAAFGLLVFPAFFSSAHLTRPDTFTLLLLMISFFLFIKKQYLLSGFCCMATIESHIIGSIVAFYIVAFIIYRRQELLSDKRALIKRAAAFLVGCAVGCIYFVALHYDHFQPAVMFNAITQHSSMSYPVKNYIIAYFISMDYVQRVPELIFTVFVLGIFVYRKYYRDHAFVTLFLVMLVLFTLVMRRPNGNYMLFTAPAFVLMFAYVFHRLGKLRKGAAIVFACFVAMYGTVYGLHRDFEFTKLTAEIRAQLVREDLPVIGVTDDWFAAMDRQFYAIYPSAPAIRTRRFTEAYVIKNDYLSDRVTNYKDTMKFLEENFDMTLLRSIEAYDGLNAAVFLARAKKP